MVDVTVDQKHTALPPVDPHAPIPEAVRKRAEAVNALYAQNGQAVAQPDSKPPPAASQQAPAPEASTPQAAAEVVETPPAAPPPQVPATTSAPERRPGESRSIPAGPDDPNDDTWKDRFVKMQGRYNASQRTNAEMQEQMAQMGEELLNSRQRPPPRATRSPDPPPPPPRYLTDQDVQNYGGDLIAFTQRAAAEAVAPQIQQLHETNADLQRRLAREQKLRMDEAVARAVPNYQEIDRNPRWHRWLSLPDLFSGYIRQELLNDAIATGNASRVISFFNGFLAEERATGHQEPVPDTRSPAATREPVIPLASLAAPGMARQAGGGDTSVPPDKPFYTRAQISQHYRDKQRGLWTGREADWNRLERDMIQAPLEGRVR